MSEETLQEVEFVGPGAMLKKAREEQGLSAEVVADKLHLRLTIINSLEADEYSADISPTFTKGYLKLYSKLVGLDEDKVLDAYQQFGALEKEPAKLQSFSQKVARQASDQRLMLVTYFVLAIVLALVVIWWMQQDDSGLGETLESVIQNPLHSGAKQNQESLNTEAATEDAQATDAPVQISEPALNNEIDSSESTAASLTEKVQRAVGENNVQEQPDAPETDSLQDALQSGLDESDIEQNLAEQAPAQEVAAMIEDNAPVSNADNAFDFDRTASSTGVPADEIAESAAQEGESDIDDFTFNDEPTVTDTEVLLVDPVELVFEFSGDCWMKLTDATGEDIAYGIKAAGRTMPVSGIPPFEVVLGAPESVQISYAGEPVDMAQFRPGYTARFNLPLTD